MCTLLYQAGLEHANHMILEGTSNVIMYVKPAWDGPDLSEDTCKDNIPVDYTQLIGFLDLF